MTRQEKSELIRLLELFFSETNFNKRNILNQNPVARLLKQNLSVYGHWKGKNRGRL